MRKRTSVESTAAGLKVSIVTLDGHLGSAADRAFATLESEIPGLRCNMHVAGEWDADASALQDCIADIADSNIVIVCMLFLEDHIKLVLPALQARRDACDAMLCFMCASEVMQLTRLGGFTMDEKQSGPLALLKKLRGSRATKKSGSSGAGQLALLRRLPRILRFIPGQAQDLRVYFLAMQYWLAGSEDNIRGLVAMMVARYGGKAESAAGSNRLVAAPIEYPEVGVYHPALAGRVGDSRQSLKKFANKNQPNVGVLVMRSYVLAGNTAHYDAFIEALEARGMNTVPVYASGLDARPAVEQFFMDGNTPTVDAFVSLTGFSLVGGPAYNDASAATEMLSAIDIPCFSAHATEFQTLEQWESSDNGLLPVEATMMVAIPELDGAVVPTLFGGRSSASGTASSRELQPHAERVQALADRVRKAVDLRTTERSQRNLAIVLFNFPPNSGSTGTAAFLSVFKSLFNTLQRLRDDGYDVDLPADADELRDLLIDGNSAEYGADANVHARIPVDDYVRAEPWLADIEKEWGPAPGKHQSDGQSIHVVGRQFGKVLVAVQPAFGYEGDPMRLLFEHGFAPTHAFSAFYRYLREDYAAHAVLHFGTHGALEFMPGKQTGMSGACWPERLIGDLPNFYLYAANNPSEATIAKRRSGATIVSYLTPPVTEAGLYRGLSDLQATLDRYRALEPDLELEKRELGELILAQATDIELVSNPDDWFGNIDQHVQDLIAALHELRTSLIPNGLHVVGESLSPEERRDLLQSMMHVHDTERSEPEAAAIVEKILQQEDPASILAESDVAPDLVWRLVTINEHLSVDSELDAIAHALDGGYVPPVAGGDLIQSAEILPTGRNIHGFDPFSLPSRFAVKAGAALAEQLLDRHRADTGDWPQTIALVLWGSDNIKSGGAPIGQALHLLGARPRFDTYGRLCGAELIPLEELGRPRIDVLMTLSGIFRDLLPYQTRMLAEAAWLAASADESPELNFVRSHVLQYQQDCECDLETAALRVYSNSVGAYGSNVNYVVENGRWEDDAELAAQYTQRKCFAYGRDGQAARHEQMLERSLQDVSVTYQNLESAEMGITSIDHYFDTLGGISKAVQKAKGEAVEVYIGDQTGAGNTIRTLADQVALETRSRMLNPRWYEGLLEHGYEGVKQIETHVTNTMGWSATTGKVAPWVYQQISETFVLDKEMRDRLAALNPMACAKVADRLLEACDRQYWSPDKDTLAALEQAGHDIEDKLEGIAEVAA